MTSIDKEPKIVIRDITVDDVERVHEFILKEQGEAEYECDKRYIEAASKRGYLRIDGRIYYPYEEKKPSSKSDYIRWIVDRKGLHFGKIAVLDGSTVGALLCYTQPENRKAFLSNIAVARQHRRKRIGLTLMKELIRFYGQGSGIEAIELNVGLSDSVAAKFFLEHDFRIIELRDRGYTMRYAFEKNRVRCTVRPYSDIALADCKTTRPELSTVDMSGFRLDRHGK